MSENDQRVSRVYLVSGREQVIDPNGRVEWSVYSLVDGESDANGPFLVCYDNNGRVVAEYRRAAIEGYGFRPRDPGERVVDLPGGR